MKYILIFFYLNIIALLFGIENELLYRQTVRVRAFSDGIEKPVYKKSGNERIENKVTVTVIELSSGDIEIQSEKFQLGKMSFFSSFQLVIPKEELCLDEGGGYLIDNLTGVYRIASSRLKAVFTGTVGLYGSNLTVTVNGMGKELSMQFYVPDEQFPKEATMEEQSADMSE